MENMDPTLKSNEEEDGFKLGDMEGLGDMIDGNDGDGTPPDFMGSQAKDKT